MSAKKPIKRGRKVVLRFRGTDGVWREVMDVGPFIAPPGYEWTICTPEKDGIRFATFIMN